MSQHGPRQPPFAFIQWKGTNACMDVHCTCGALLHIDADFAYNVRCPRCGQCYETGSYVTMFPVQPEALIGAAAITEFDGNEHADHYTVVAPEDNHRQCEHGWTIGGHYKCERCP